MVENTQKGLVENNKNNRKFSSLDEYKVGRKRLVENQSRMTELMIEDPKISKQKMSEIIGISTTAIDKNINLLKKEGFIERIGPDKGGYWKVIKK